MLIMKKQREIHAYRNYIMLFAEFAPNLYTRGDEFSLPHPNLSPNLRLILIFPSHLRLKQDKRKTLFSAKNLQ